MLVCILQTKTNCEYWSFKDFPYVIENTKEIFSFLAASFLKVAFIQKEKNNIPNHYSEHEISISTDILVNFLFTGSNLSSIGSKHFAWNMGEKCLASELLYIKTILLVLSNFFSKVLKQYLFQV